MGWGNGRIQHTICALRNGKERAGEGERGIEYSFSNDGRLLCLRTAVSSDGCTFRTKVLCDFRMAARYSIPAQKLAIFWGWTAYHCRIRRVDGWGHIGLCCLSNLSSMLAHDLACQCMAMITEGARPHELPCRPMLCLDRGRCALQLYSMIDGDGAGQLADRGIFCDGDPSIFCVTLKTRRAQPYLSF